MQDKKKDLESPKKIKQRLSNPDQTPERAKRTTDRQLRALLKELQQKKPAYSQIVKIRHREKALFKVYFLRAIDQRPARAFVGFEHATSALGIISGKYVREIQNNSFTGNLLVQNLQQMQDWYQYIYITISYRHF